MNPYLKDEIWVLGFLHYHAGDSVAFRSGHIVQTREYTGFKMDGPKFPHYIVDADIVKGNSGGPVLDSQMRVAGVAVKGVDITGKIGPDDQLSSFVPLYLIPNLL